MSDIKIQPSATGSATVTLTAPTTGTARTVTLPDSTDTLAVNSDVTNKLPLAGGTLTGDLLIDKSANNARLTLGGGYVGQIKFENNPIVTNWMVTSQYVKSNAFEIIPSTAVGGDTFTTPVLQITSDGRGLSQFTAKAWVAWNQTGTIAIIDSHNVSSMSDYGTGEAKINLTNNMATADSYAVSSMASKASGAPSGSNSTFTTIGESLPVTGPIIGMIYNGSASDRSYASAIIFGD